MKHILVIGIGWEQVPLIEALYRRGFLLFGVHYHDRYEKKSYFEDVLLTDLRNIGQIADFARKHQINAVIADQDDYAQFAQAFVAETLHLPGPSIRNAQISGNKYLQRLCAKEKGLSVPEFQLIRCEEDIRTFAEKVNYPIILKPIDNRGSFGVKKINREEEISDAFRESLTHSLSFLLIAEEFIEGTEITIDGYCFQKIPKSLSLAEKKKVNDRVQVSIDIKYPGTFEEKIYQKAFAYNEHVNQALGYTFGMTHSEYIIKENGDVYLVESANRGGGCLTSEVIVPAVSGIDLIDIYIEDVLGNSGEKYKTPERNQVILKFFTFQPGKIKRIHGQEELKREENVLQFRLTVKEEDRIEPTSSDADRHGFLIITSEENKNIREVCQRLMDKIRIEYY